MFTFHVIQSKGTFPTQQKNCAYLRIDNWNDYSFITMFDIVLFDQEGQMHDLGQVKIGFTGQTTEQTTYSEIGKQFEKLEERFFSLGQSVDYYKKLAVINDEIKTEFLLRIRDIVFQPNLITAISEEDVFGTSLLRHESLSIIKGQYARVLEGGAERTNYYFRYQKLATESSGEVNLSFDVEFDANPPTNIHAVIGRNGVGKTTILNGMINSITRKDQTTGAFKYKPARFSTEREIESDYFSSLVSVSFSAFDPFVPPREQPDPAKGTCYFYVGLKEPSKPDYHRTISSLQRDAIDALVDCFNNKRKTSRWLSAVEKLGLDGNFSSHDLKQIKDVYFELRAKHKARGDTSDFKIIFLNELSPFLNEMSSGHAIVFLTISRLVATVEEKTLILLDEPESHLHPPLLSAFIRALSDLLLDRNGVAIIATHSPVVLQEIPKSCIWKINREGLSIATERPKIETFGENVGILTSEVFGLEVERSGFHQLLKTAVTNGHSYEEIITAFARQIGYEGRAILKVLLAHKEKE